jgi:hypothetical protein
MQIKDEGLAWPPFPVGRQRAPEVARRGVRIQRDSAEPRCEMCGHRVIATHCKRICVKCGFMTGCSEGI